MSRPNIVILYADDLGFGDVSCNNPERGRVRTPHIDRLAKDGMRFTDAHSSSGVCSPSRYTLLTGRYHWRTRLQRGIVDLWGKPLIAPGRLTVAGLAARHGYRTACIGKWHLGWDWPIDEADQRYFQAGGYGGKKDLVATDAHREAWRRTFSRSIPGGPTAVGFHEYFGTDVPNWPPYCFIENDRTVGVPSEYAPVALFGKHQASQQGPALPGWTFEPILPALTERAEAFIRREAGAKRPFLLYLPFTSPHTPIAVGDEWKGKSGLVPVSDFVMQTDAMVGRVLAALDRAGVASNTLVLFSSDNGMDYGAGGETLEKMGHYPSGPYRGYKSNAWDGGHRVPFIIRWPAKVKPGVVSRQLVHQADVMATLAEIMGDTLPPDAGEDSFSLMALLEGQDKPVREHAVSASIQGLPAVRLGPWKYIPGKGSGGWWGKDDAAHQLYQMDEDPGESRNLVAEQPERVKEMAALLERLIVKGRSNAGPDQKNDVEVKRFQVAQ